MAYCLFLTVNSKHRRGTFRHGEKTAIAIFGSDGFDAARALKLTGSDE